jgi:hypothetical protein
MTEVRDSFLLDLEAMAEPHALIAHNMQNAPAVSRYIQIRGFAYADRGDGEVPTIQNVASSHVQ